MPVHKLDVCVRGHLLLYVRVVHSVPEVAIITTNVGHPQLASVTFLCEQVRHEALTVFTKAVYLIIEIHLIWYFFGSDYFIYVLYQ
jgi:hypothetical protein